MVYYADLVQVLFSWSCYADLHDISQLYANCSRTIAIGLRKHHDGSYCLMKICCTCFNFCCSWILADYCGRDERWMTSTECYLGMLCNILWAGQFISIHMMCKWQRIYIRMKCDIECLLHNMYVFVVHHIIQN